MTTEATSLKLLVEQSLAQGVRISELEEKVEALTRLLAVESAVELIRRSRT